MNLFIKKENKQSQTAVVSTDRINLTAGENAVKSAKEADKLRISRQPRNVTKSDKNKRKPGADSKNRKVLKSVQDTIPYKIVCDDYIFLVEKNRYSKTYAFEDINYSAGTREEQEEMLLAYVDALNGFDTTADVQITIHNNKINKKEFKKRILLSDFKDGFDDYRAEYNEMLSNKMTLGQNGISCKKYVTVTVIAVDLEMAKQRFLTYELHLFTCFGKLGSQTKALNANERIRILTDIFRGVNKEVTEISKSQFLRGAEKTLCCPDYFEFKRDYFMFDDKYARCVLCDNCRQALKTSFLRR
ncbi:hypothetical protein FACS189499_07460 [Clostridia bacterium]|nr:hypothetical protein FACS189499_07460 [Clostridia bacterium]